MTLVDLGIKQLNGTEAKGCPHMAQWLPLFTRLCIHHGIIHQSLDIVQAAGGSPLSGGTHVEGTCLDVVGSQCSTTFVQLAREAGARAAWGRGEWVKSLGAPANAINGFQDHVHLHLVCPCKSGADYQTVAVDAGHDGLVGEASDYHRQPSAKRDWATGIQWMKTQLPASVSPATGSTTSGTTSGSPSLTSSGMVAATTTQETITVDITKEELAALVYAQADKAIMDNRSTIATAVWGATFGGGTKAMAKIAQIVAKGGAR